MAPSATDPAVHCAATLFKRPVFSTVKSMPPVQLLWDWNGSTGSILSTVAYMGTTNTLLARYQYQAAIRPAPSDAQVRIRIVSLTFPPPCVPATIATAPAALLSTRCRCSGSVGGCVLWTDGPSAEILMAYCQPRLSRVLLITSKVKSTPHARRLELDYVAPRLIELHSEVAGAPLVQQPRQVALSGRAISCILALALGTFRCRTLTPCGTSAAAELPVGAPFVCST